MLRFLNIFNLNVGCRNKRLAVRLTLFRISMFQNILNNHVILRLITNYLFICGAVQHVVNVSIVFAEKT